MGSLYLPEGSSYFPDELQRKVQEFNPNYYLRICRGFGCRNQRCDSWVLAESCNDGRAKPRAHSKGNFPAESIIPMLRERLSPNSPDAYEEVMKHNARREQELSEQSDHAAEEAADRLYTALKRL